MKAIERTHIDVTGSVGCAPVNKWQPEFNTSLPTRSVDLDYRLWHSVPDALRQDAAEALEETEANGQRAPWLPLPGQSKHEPDLHRYLLLLRFALFNLVAFALLGAAYAQGLIDIVLDADRTYLSVVIFIAFLGGLAVCAMRVWQTSRELNSARQTDPSAQSNAMQYLASLLGANAEGRANLASVLRLRLSNRIGIVRHIANSLVLLGLIGTVLGFIIALSGVDPEHATDISSIAPMVSTLISGMSTALYTTLIGAVLNLWLMANHQLLVGGTVKVIAALIELAEEHARHRII